MKWLLPSVDIEMYSYLSRQCVVDVRKPLCQLLEVVLDFDLFILLHLYLLGYFLPLFPEVLNA